MLLDKQKLQLYSIAQEFHDLRSMEDFKEFIKTRIRSIFPHEIAVCGTGDLRSGHISRLINIDFPEDYLESVVQSGRLPNSHTFRTWVEEQAPVFYFDGEANGDVEPNWLSTIRRCGIHSIASHGLVEPVGQSISYFAFGNVRAYDLYVTKLFLIALIPYLHYSLTRVLTIPNGISSNETNYVDAASCKPEGLQKTTQHISLLSMRELEILGWVAVGKSNWEIGKILGISQFTVNNHLKSIFKKLFVTNRTQAVTKGIALSLIPQVPSVSG